MTKDDDKPPADEPTPLKGSVKTAKVTDRGVELVVRLQNPGDRALHYIADVRALQYDPASKRLTVRLSDAGRTVIPGALAKLPDFRVIDPNSNTEVALELPETMVRLAGAAASTGEVVFEEHRIADAAEIEIDIGWADTPFYQDTRETDDQRLPTERWQQGKLQLSRKMPSRSK